MATRADSALRPTYSRRRISEPDLTVVVGGKEFLHHSVLLCLASEYFDKMLSSDTRESCTMRIEFPDKDPEEWVRFCRYLEPRSLFTANTFPVNYKDAKALLPWFHLFGMTNLLEECDQRLSMSSPEFLDADLNDVNHQRSTMVTEILVWADTAATYDLPKTLEAMMKELNKAVNSFPGIITTEILEDMRPFWSTAAGSELWDGVKARLPDDVKSNHNDNDAALKANKLLIELVAQSCKVPALIRAFKSEADFNAIVNLMKKYRSCPRIQHQGCAAFRHHCLRNASHHKDGIEAIVSAMAAHSVVSEVQEQGRAALGNLACNTANKVSIAANNGIEAIVSAMTAYISVSNVQERGCLALGNIAFVSEVQECGCFALGNLACNDANCVSISANHGIEAIVSAMTTHSNVSKVQRYGCGALQNLACNNDENRVSIAAKHGIEAIVSAMTAHINETTVQKRGCKALGHLASKNDANRVSIAAKHGVAAIVSAMAAHINLPEVQQYGCLALSNMTLNESVAARIQLEGGVAVLEQNSSNSNAGKALQQIEALINLS